ncbi:MAG: peptidoglycan editing factor PgeF [Acidobacteria bacterium]|nr:peptidoglycan editing factor PgeF [Acidobacteriota bacterium]MBI3661902.1 peptidoglycan editing factor PgeF [Acidobacteriota bacterium]
MRRAKLAAAVWRTRRAQGVQILEAGALGKIPWLVHGFTLRPGGASMLDGKRVFNLGRTDWDTRENVLANRGKLLTALGAKPMQIVSQRQFHSTLTRVLDAAPEQPVKGDALITRTPGLLLAVLTADCVPILLADTKRRAVAAVHAGWRGTLARIAEKTLGKMRMTFGTCPRDVLAVLGPGIGRGCYEVGAEVAQAFHSQFAHAAEWFEGPFERLVSDDTPNPLQWLNMHPPGHQPPPPSVHLDLLAANRWQLEHAGVPTANILASNLCTACRKDILFSHRAEFGRTGRLMGVIGIRV